MAEFIPALISAGTSIFSATAGGGSKRNERLAQIQAAENERLAQQKQLAERGDDLEAQAASARRAGAGLRGRLQFRGTGDLGAASETLGG